MNFMENTKELLLVHANMKQPPRDHTSGVNIMLTPQFYTMKREEIPVKYTYQAKRIAPSLFDGLLENQESYRYFVAKEDKDWLFIAYNPEEIKELLEEKGILPEKVSKIYFAQQIAEHLSHPVLLGENDALVNVGGIMTVVPQAVLDADERPMQITRDFTPKKGVAFEGRSRSFISTNNAYTLAAVFAMFAVIYFVEGSRYKGDGAAEKAQIEALLENYPALESSYTRKSIADKYKAIDTKERKKRDIVKSLSHMIFKGSRLRSLSVDDKRFKAEFSCKDAGVTKKLSELAKKEKFNTSKIANSNDLKIEGTL